MLLSAAVWALHACSVGQLPVMRPGCCQGAGWHCRDSSCESTALVHLRLYLHVNSHRERVSAKHLALALHLEATSDNCWALQPWSQGGNAWQLPGHGSLSPAARQSLTVGWWLDGEVTETYVLGRVGNNFYEGSRQKQVFNTIWDDLSNLSKHVY